MKEITFVVTAATAIGMGFKGNADLVRVVLPVDLNKLTTKALELAKSVSTLERKDDLSKVYVVGPTQRELFIKEGKIEEMERFIRFWGSEEDLDKSTTIVWCWDCLKRNETTEQYFERHAAMIEKAGGYEIITFGNCIGI
jgi:hypothetical protein